jgi:adenylosuccinate synthase
VQVKAYTTRVGSGPFPTELLGKTGDLLRASGMEFGTTTGRPRRCGWLDIVALKYCCQINGFSSLNLTKLDVLTGLKEIKLGISYYTNDGNTVQSFPADLDLLEQIKVREKQFIRKKNRSNRLSCFIELCLSMQLYKHINQRNMSQCDSCFSKQLL